MNEKNTNKLESLLSIDEFNLDKELDRQPRLFMKFALKLADARLKHAEAKAELDLIAAELALSIRHNPKKFGIDKITETVVEQVITLQDPYQAAQRAMLQAKHSVDNLEAIKEALEHKKYALQGRVTLHVQNYNASVKVRKPARDGMAEMGKRSARRALGRY